MATPFGQWVAERRRSLNLSQQEAADKAGITQGAWSKIENIVTEPRSSTINRVVRGMDLDRQEVLDVAYTSRQPSEGDPLKRAIGCRIAEAREAKRWRQEDLALSLSVAQNTVSAWESGRIDIPATNLWRAAEALGKPPGFFFEAGPSVAPEQPPVQLSMMNDLEPSSPSKMEQDVADIKQTLRTMEERLRTISPRRRSARK
jgi:transcriptional regulator with XRE-family HTH domain